MATDGDDSFQVLTSTPPRKRDAEKHQIVQRLLSARVLLDQDQSVDSRTADSIDPSGSNPFAVPRQESVKAILTGSPKTAPRTPRNAPAFDAEISMSRGDEFSVTRDDEKLDVFNASASNLKPLPKGKGGVKKTQSVPTMSALNKDLHSKGQYMHGSKLPRSFSHEFINFRPSIMLQMIVDMPTVATAGISDNFIRISSAFDFHKQSRGSGAAGMGGPPPGMMFAAAPSGGDIPPTAPGDDDKQLSLEFGEHAHKLSADEANTYRKLSVEQRQSIAAQLAELEYIRNQGWTFNLAVAAGQAIIGPFLYGYNTSALNVPKAHIQDTVHYSLSDNTFNTLQTAFCAGGMVGALCAGPIADRIGRKKLLLSIDVIFIIGGIICYFLAMKELYWFLIGRFILGLGGGAATAVVPPYLGEISPPAIRGAVGTLNQVMICSGIVVSEIFGYHSILGDDDNWKFLLLIPAVPCLLQLFTFFTFPESPQWLVQKRRETDARAALRKLRMVENVEADMNIMRAVVQHSASSANLQAKKERQNVKRLTIEDNTVNSSMPIPTHMDTTGPADVGNISNPDIDINASAQASASPNQIPSTQVIVHKKKKMEKEPLLTSPPMSEAEKGRKRALHKAFIISIVVQVVQQLSGINGIFYYSDDTFENAGIKNADAKWGGDLAVAMANLLSVFVAVLLMDRLGRRVLLFISLGGMCVSAVLLTIALFLQDKSTVFGYMCIVFMIFYVIFFELGLGPIPWLIVAEIAPTSHRGLIMSVASCTNWTCNLLIAQFANPVVKLAKYIPFLFFCAVGIVFVWRYVPETKGKNESELQAELAK